MHQIIYSVLKRIGSSKNIYIYIFFNIDIILLLDLNRIIHFHQSNLININLYESWTFESHNFILLG